MNEVISLTDIRRVFVMGDQQFEALKGVSFAVAEGEFVAIMGASGSGKSTCMNILGCLDRPTSGQYLLDGLDVGGMDGDQLAAIRNKKLGFVFQGFNLLARTPAVENVELPLIYSPDDLDIKAKAMGALEAVGLGDRVGHQPSELSGGQQQRVAIARALVNDPALILADEPTGNLDSASSQEVMAIFKKLHSDGRTVILVTHEPEVAAQADRIIRMKDGQVVSDERRAN